MSFEIVSFLCFCVGFASEAEKVCGEKGWYWERFVDQVFY